MRFVPVPADRAEICQRTALELQAESILRADRKLQDVSFVNTNGCGGNVSQNYRQ